MRPLSYRASIDFLYGLEKSGIKLGLDRTINLLSWAGNPEKSFKSIHIAGTNGKGSVACFLNSILVHGGFRTGLFTSPHLVSYRERMRVNGNVIGRGELSELTTYLREGIIHSGASFFEATTALAFEYFRRRRVDVAVVEVGMGGRLDSTNVLLPEVTCITTIDYDHTLYLGKTLPKIAREKAGIIKERVPVVCGKTSSSATRVITKIAARKKAPCYLLGKDASYTVISSDINGSVFEYKGLANSLKLKVGIPGLHQVGNAALAVLTAEVLNECGFSIARRAIEEGLSNAFWPGRLQVLRQRPFVICDAAHNISGVRSLADSLVAFGFEPDVIVFGVLRDKRYDQMLRILAKLSRVFILTKPQSPRALGVGELREAAKGIGLRCFTCAKSSHALDKALEICKDNGKILVCGSIYLLGEVMQKFGYKPWHVLCQ